MWCVIPVAGLGTRIGSPPSVLPKALLPIAGRPIVQHLLARLPHEITDLCFIIGESGRIIREVLGSRKGQFRLHYVTQVQPRGVGDAVLRSRDLVSGPFLVVMGDSYYETSLAPYLQSWRRSGADGAVLVEPIVEGPGYPVGLVHVEGPRVVKIAKAHHDGGADYRVCGSMILPESAFDVCVEVDHMCGAELELEEVVERLIRQGAEFIAVPYRGWRRNINTAEDLRVVEQRVRTTSVAPTADSTR